MLFGVYKNVTDPKQYELLEMSRISGFVDRARGTGRPTKKERRALDAFVDPAMFGFDEEDWDEDEENGCKNYNRPDYEKTPAGNWCCDWKGKHR